MSRPPPQAPKNPARGGGSSGGASDQRIAIENVELLAKDQEDAGRMYHQQQQQQPPPPPPHLQHPSQHFVYGGMPPVYGMPPPSRAYYGSTGGGGGPPPNPAMYHQAPGAAAYVTTSSSNAQQQHQNRRAYSQPLPTGHRDPDGILAGPPIPQYPPPSEYQSLIPPPPPPGTPAAFGGGPGGFNYGSTSALPPPSSGGGGSGGFIYGIAPPDRGSLAYAATTAMNMESTTSVGALTLDDIERSFNQVVNHQYNNHHRSASASDIPPPPLPVESGPRPSRGRSPKQQTHRRAGSTGGMLPPMGKSSPRSGHGRKRADFAASASRGRSFSANFQGGVPPPAMRGHRRSVSRASSTDFSVASIASMVSVVSDISKSAFFGGVSETGNVQMHYPTEHVRLIMQESLPRGHVFCHPTDDAVYEAYHAAAEEIIMQQWENVDEDDDLGLNMQHGSLQHNNPYKSLQCHCRCNNCAGCTGKTRLLPRQNFVINVPNDIYRRLLDEISESQAMPCGLYFCGHHEDVSNPSIMIATGIVVTLFILMGVAACL